MRRALGASDPRIPNLGGCRFLLTPGAGAKSLLVEDVVELLVHGPVGEEL